MRILLEKSAKQKFNEEQWCTIRDAIQFFIDEHSLDEYDRKVYVRFANKINGGLGVMFSSYGNCITYFTPKNGSLVTSHYVINLRYGRMKRVLNTLFHEMTHVLQDARGDIVRMNDGSEFYKGVHYSIDKLAKPSYKDYREFPWEVEAREVADAMMTKWNATRPRKPSFLAKLFKFWS